MNWFQKWFLKPLYIALMTVAVLALAVLSAGAGVAIHDGWSWDRFISEYVNVIQMQSFSFLAAYYIKWEHVYGPPTKEKLNARTNG